MESFWYNVRRKFGVKWILWSLFLFYVIYRDQSSVDPAGPISILLTLLILPWLVVQYRHRGGRRSKIELQGKKLKLFHKTIRLRTGVSNNKSTLVRFREESIFIGENNFLVKDIKSISFDFEKKLWGRLKY